MKETSSATRLLTALAHDIRTPLQAMTLKLVLIELKLGDRLDEQDREDFESLRSSIQAILDLQNEILHHARLADDRMVPEEMEFAVDDVLADCLQVVEPLATQKGLSVETDLRAAAIVRSDRSMIQHIVTNLLSNAIRYTERGYIMLRSRVDERGLCVEVEDSGIGIGPEDRTRVFERYFRANPGRDDGTGFGLGLAMARQMSSLMAGTLSVRSEIGQGSTFTLSLPPRLLAGPSTLIRPSQEEQPEAPAALAVDPVRRQVVVQNESGIHLRAASCFVQLAQQYRAQVRVGRDGKTVDGKSILDLATLAAECGATLDIEAVGSDAAEAIGELAKLLQTGFGELVSSSGNGHHNS